MKYLVSFYGLNGSIGGINKYRALENYMSENSSSRRTRMDMEQKIQKFTFIDELKVLSMPDLIFKSGKDLTREEILGHEYYSLGSCREFDTFSEAIEFYTAVISCFSSVILATTEGSIICGYPSANFETK